MDNFQVPQQYSQSQLRLNSHTIIWKGVNSKEATKLKLNLVTWLCPILCDPMDYSPQAPLSMEFSRQEYWSGLPFPSPGDFLHPGIKPGSPALQADSLPSGLLGKQRSYKESPKRRQNLMLSTHQSSSNHALYSEGSLTVSQRGHFWQKPQSWLQWYQKSIVFYLSPVCNDGYIALSSMTLYSGSNSGNTHSAGLISSLILVNLIK